VIREGRWSLKAASDYRAFVLGLVEKAAFITDVGFRLVVVCSWAAR
jgi:hypothetical protein